MTNEQFAVLGLGILSIRADVLICTAIKLVSRLVEPKLKAETRNSYIVDRVLPGHRVIDMQIHNERKARVRRNHGPLMQAHIVKGN